jgi:DNA-binding response OmpR family regulator
MTADKPTILIVDDEALVRRVLGDALRRSGYTIESAASGHEALERLQEPGVDLLLLDLQLGDLDGVEVMRAARQRWPQLPIVMLTAHGSLPSAIEAVRCGAADYLLKPIGLDELRTRVGAALSLVEAERARGQELRAIFTRMGAVLRDEGLLDEIPPPAPAPTTIYRSGPLCLDTQRHTVTLNSQLVEVTPSEFTILRELLSHPGAVVTCRQLVQALNTPTDDEEEARQLIRPHIVRLRRKVEPDAQQPTYLLAVRSVGYRWAGE